MENYFACNLINNEFSLLLEYCWMYKSEQKHSQFNLYSTVDNKYYQGTLQRIVLYNLEEINATAERRN